MFYSVIETRDFSLFNQSAQAFLKGYFIKICVAVLDTLGSKLALRVWRYPLSKDFLLFYPLLITIMYVLSYESCARS